MKDSADDGYFLRNFEDLIYDAVHLLYRAIDENIENDHDGYGFTFTRTSILNSLLLFECGANCCINALELRGPFEEDIERLPFLSKYQFFLGRIKPDATFDRECKEVRAVRELKPLRDNYVHEMARGLQHAASVLGAGLQAAGAGGL